MAADLGPLLAAVHDEWEHAIVIADRAGVNRRGVGQQLARLVAAGVIVSKRERGGRLRVYRNVDLVNAPVVETKHRSKKRAPCDKCGKRPGTMAWGDAMTVSHGGGQRWCESCVLRAQIKHAEERGRALPKLRHRLVELERKQA